MRLGHIVVVTNRGLHTASINSQPEPGHARLVDITREVPAEAFYLYDPDSALVLARPITSTTRSHEAEFGVDGTATFRMAKGRSKPS